MPTSTYFVHFSGNYALTVFAVMADSKTDALTKLIESGYISSYEPDKRGGGLYRVVGGIGQYIAGESSYIDKQGKPQLETYYVSIEKQTDTVMRIADYAE